MDGFYGTLAAAIAGTIAVIALAVAFRRVNLGPVRCPNCGTDMPRIRRPGSSRQAMQGGWTCANCGTELDRWGKAIAR